jgi:hypothetical protein
MNENSNKLRSTSWMRIATNSEVHNEW